ncbi:anion permease [Armatimonas sp.]|uniref:inorganic phosphate transporter n=1 Tax=Armatimonas sp. TaxID=1872638 RepID=UPI00286D14DF|nr:anion permease [Armatimonas sp.]
MDITTISLLVLCLVIALGFEFVNGFHDTANAVATVIYTRSLKPTVAVIWSGLINFLGVLSVLGAGAGVAFKIVGLIPTDMLVGASGSMGIWMLLSILITAVLWNLATWFVGLPASSSHTLIGSITGVGITWGLLAHKDVNLEKFYDTLKGLALAPLVGFGVAALIFLAMKALIKRPELFQEPKGNTPPPWPIRLLLIGTCTGVSYFHGSNDGQKGIGLMMLVLIALLPGQFTVNPNFNAEKIGTTLSTVKQVEALVERPELAKVEKAVEADKRLHKIAELLANRATLTELPLTEQTELRKEALKAASALKKVAKEKGLSAEDKDLLDKGQKEIKATVEFVAPWVTVAVALALGVGTMVGWKRIVVTVGEKIGKAHLNYGQGAAAEMTAMLTIMTADMLAAPVSTTHILSSGIAGTMAANKSGLQSKTIRNILIAWVLTLPVTIVVSGFIFWLTAGRFIQ